MMQRTIYKHGCGYCLGKYETETNEPRNDVSCDACMESRIYREKYGCAGEGCDEVYNDNDRRQWYRNTRPSSAYGTNKMFMCKSCLSKFEPLPKCHYCGKTISDRRHSNSNGEYSHYECRIKFESELSKFKAMKKEMDKEAKCIIC
jgi:hypothetical protein